MKLIFADSRPQAAVLTTPLGSVIPYSTLTWSRTTFLHHFSRALCSTLLPYSVQVSHISGVQYPGIALVTRFSGFQWGSHR